jgi:hypothetical protein
MSDISEELADDSGIPGCDAVSLGEFFHVESKDHSTSGSSSLTLGSSSLVFGCLILGDKSATIILKVANYSPNDTVTHVPCSTLFSTHISSPCFDQNVFLSVCTSLKKKLIKLYTTKNSR